MTEQSEPEKNRHKNRSRRLTLPLKLSGNIGKYDQLLLILSGCESIMSLTEPARNSLSNVSSCENNFSQTYISEFPSDNGQMSAEMSDVQPSLFRHSDPVPHVHFAAHCQSSRDVSGHASPASSLHATKPGAMATVLSAADGSLHPSTPTPVAKAAKLRRARNRLAQRKHRSCIFK